MAIGFLLPILSDRNPEGISIKGRINKKPETAIPTRKRESVNSFANKEKIGEKEAQARLNVKTSSESVARFL